VSLDFFFKNQCFKENGQTFGCIKETVDYIHQVAANNSTVNVLVTGSLHLVGGILSFEDSQASL
jgi:folylpolyglutamate synthase/dihydropteroate synthase